MQRAKEQIIRQRDFAIRLGVTTGYLRRMLKGSIDFTERITSMIEAELSPDSEADIRRMVREWMAKKNNKDTSK